MRLLCRLLSIVFLSLLVSSARATQIIIQDPPDPGTFSITDVRSTQFTVSFSDSCMDELPSGALGFNAAGCFAFKNLTGSEWTSITLTTSYPPLDGGYTCSAPSFFSTESCGMSAGQYVLSFTNGGIPDQTNANGLSYYVISESDITPPENLTFQATVTLASGSSSVTPEPSAFVLLGTGLLSAGTMMWTRRRVQV